MNANELADELDWVCENHLVGIGDADFKTIATMLRQQQAEIEALKLGDIQWSHAFDLAKIEIADLKVEIEELTYQLDHVIPISLGGKHDDKNIELLCPKCNLKKSNKDPIDWANENGRLI